MQISNHNDIEVSRKRDRSCSPSHPTADAVIITPKTHVKTRAVACQAPPSSTFPLLSVLVSEAAKNTSTSFRITKSATAISTGDDSSNPSIDHCQGTDRPTEKQEQDKSRSTNNMLAPSSNQVGSFKYSRRSSQIYPTVIAATQMAIATIEENDCEMLTTMQQSGHNQQLTEIQYGYCQHWDDNNRRGAMPPRRYQRRNSCVGSLSLPGAYAPKLPATAESHQTVTTLTLTPSSVSHAHLNLQPQDLPLPLTQVTMIPPAAPHRRVERRNSQTAAMLYVATQMATIDESYGQLSLEDDDSSSKRPSTIPSSSFFVESYPACKKRRLQDCER